MSPRTASWQALGTSVVLRVTDAGALHPARAAVEAELVAIDRACSRFREDSELARVNAARGRAVRVGELFVEALGVALRAAELTGGDVDPTVGRALELAGYDRDFAALAPVGDARPPAHPVIRARVRTGWRTVELDPERLEVRIPAAIRLDLGATAKALAADRAAAAAALATGAGVLVSLGGDIATCGPAPAGGWHIYVTDDHRSDTDAPGQHIVIAGGGLATSSTAVRRWSRDGVAAHHIIDPATQAPVAKTWRTVSVAAASCVDANIASTAALVRAERAPRWLSERGLPARLVASSGRVSTLCGWPSPAQAGVRVAPGVTASPAPITPETGPC